MRSFTWMVFVAVILVATCSPLPRKSHRNRHEEDKAVIEELRAELEELKQMIHADMHKTEVNRDDGELEEEEKRQKPKKKKKKNKRRRPSKPRKPEVRGQEHEAFDDEAESEHTPGDPIFVPNRKPQSNGNFPTDRNPPIDKNRPPLQQDPEGQINSQNFGEDEPFEPAFNHPETDSDPGFGAFERPSIVPSASRRSDPDGIEDKEKEYDDDDDDDKSDDLHVTNNTSRDNNPSKKLPRPETTSKSSLVPEVIVPVQPLTGSAVDTKAPLDVPLDKSKKALEEDAAKEFEPKGEGSSKLPKESPPKSAQTPIESPIQPLAISVIPSDSDTHSVTPLKNPMENDEEKKDIEKVLKEELPSDENHPAVIPPPITSSPTPGAHSQGQPLVKSLLHVGGLKHIKPEEKGLEDERSVEEPKLIKEETELPAILAPSKSFKTPYTNSSNPLPVVLDEEPVDEETREDADINKPEPTMKGQPGVTGIDLPASVSSKNPDAKSPEQPLGSLPVPEDDATITEPDSDAMEDDDATSVEEPKMKGPLGENKTPNKSSVKPDKKPSDQPFGRPAAKKGRPAIQPNSEEAKKTSHKSGDKSFGRSAISEETEPSYYDEPMDDNSDEYDEIEEPQPAKSRPTARKNNVSSIKGSIPDDGLENINDENTPEEKIPSRSKNPGTKGRNPQENAIPSSKRKTPTNRKAAQSESPMITIKVDEEARTRFIENSMKQGGKIPVVVLSEPDFSEVPLRRIPYTPRDTPATAPSTVSKAADFEGNKWANSGGFPIPAGAH